MSALKSVALAIDVTTQRRDQAGHYLGEAQRAYLFAQNQLAQLENYAADTEAKWGVAAQVSTSPELMRHHYQFMDRLHHAIGLQHGTLDDLKRRVAAAQQQALAAEFRLASLKQVLKKKQADLSILQGRREQRQMDDLAALQHGRAVAYHRSGERL